MFLQQVTAQPSGAIPVPGSKRLVTKVEGRTSDSGLLPLTSDARSSGPQLHSQAALLPQRRLKALCRPALRQFLSSPGGTVGRREVYLEGLVRPLARECLDTPLPLEKDKKGAPPVRERCAHSRPASGLAAVFHTQRLLPALSPSGKRAP